MSIEWHQVSQAVMDARTVSVISESLVWEASIPKTFSPNSANLPGFVLYTYLAQLPQTDASPAP